MFQLIKFLALLIAFLVTGCASAPSEMSFDSPIGVWNVKEKNMSGKTLTGKVTIVDETKGSYTNPVGRIEFYAIDDQRIWKGYWIEESGSTACPEEKSGSMFWGEQIYQFNEAYNQYIGTWDSCGEGPKYGSKGFR